jgi:hypothetical protein
MYVNQVVKDYLGEGLISTLPEAAQLSPMTLGKVKADIKPTECTLETREIVITPAVAGKIVMSNEWVFLNSDKIPNRCITKTRAENEMVVLFNLMNTDQFQPHQGVLAGTPDGRWIEGGGRVINQIKSGKTYTYTVDVVKPDQRSIARYQLKSRAGTALMSNAQGWGMNFGLEPKQSIIAQQIFNGILWHAQGILGSTVRSSTKAAIFQQETLDKDIRILSEFYAHTKVPKNMNVSALATIELLALRAGYSTDKVEAFRNGLLSGTGLETRDARRYVREFLITRQKGRTVRYQEQIAYMKWAFDKFYTKTPVSALRKTSLVTF